MLIFLLLARHPLLPLVSISTGLVLLGAGLGFWAIWHMRRSHLSVLPDLPLTAKLITSGPYRWLRHPMYSAVLIVTSSGWVAAPNPTDIFMWLILALVLDMKAKIEEAKLQTRFPDFADYKKRSWRLVPGVY